VEPRDFGISRLIRRSSGCPPLRKHGSIAGNTVGNITGKEHDHIVYAHDIIGEFFASSLLEVTQIIPNTPSRSSND
jgi:hypothetical protein